MAIPRACLAKILSHRNPMFVSLSALTLHLHHPKHLSLHATHSLTLSTSSHDPHSRWKPTCLYHSQGKCTKVPTFSSPIDFHFNSLSGHQEGKLGGQKIVLASIGGESLGSEHAWMDDPIHLETFNHDCSKELQVNISELNKIHPQDLDFFLVLDLEGRVEILEFPVLLISATTLQVEDIFHRFVRPSKMSERKINEYIQGKYGKFGVDRVWHDTAIPFTEVIQQFGTWLMRHQLWMGEGLNRAAFVTCGNWDLKTKVPQQCEVSKIKLPPYFMEWINLKDVYLNFYNRRATGMVTMMKELQIPLVGSHHLGIDDTKNIARVLQHMLLDGALIQITARRNPTTPRQVKFLFKNRIV